MSEPCGEPHPTDENETCAKNSHPFGTHMSLSGLIWPGLAMPQRSAKGSSGRVLGVVRAMQATGAGTRTGPPDDRTGPPAAAIVDWRHNRSAWIELAKRALREVAEHNDTFTNELVWARVPDIGERRAMVVVIRHGVSSGWMHEDSAIRVHGVWRTLDGATFPLNKLVPVYRSDLFDG